MADNHVVVVRQFTTFLPLVRLPLVVFHMIIDYLCPKERALLSQTSRTLRNKLNLCGNAWKDVNFVISPKRIKDCEYLVQVLLERKASFLSFNAVCSEKIQNTILQSFPDLLSLSIPMVSSSTPMYIQKYCQKVKSLHIFNIKECHLQGLKSNFVQALVDLERLCLEAKEGDPFDDILVERAVFRSLTHPALTHLELHFEEFDIVWICQILKFYERLKSLRFYYSRRLMFFGEKIYSSRLLPNGFESLEDVTLHGPGIHVINSSAVPSIRVAIETLCDKSVCLKTLDLSFYNHEGLLEFILSRLIKITSLKRLILANCLIIYQHIFEVNLPKLVHLELRNTSINGLGLGYIASSLSCSLKYLGLSNCNNIDKKTIMSLPTLFHVFDTLDLSGCNNLCDEVLQEYYLNTKSSKLYPRMLIAKGCSFISVEMIQKVRNAWKNKLIIISQ